MTNEEKAIEICCEPIRCEYNCQWCSMSAAKNDCLQMAEWKDEQMKEALNNILIECDACFDEQTTNTLESIIKHQIEIL